MSLWESLFCGRVRSELSRVKSERDGYLVRVNKLTDDLVECDAEKIRLARDFLRELDSQYACNLHLREALDASIQIPDIGCVLGTPILYDPWIAELPAGDVKIADEEYYAYQYDEWVAALGLVQPVVREVRRRWIREISDCDNWATTMYDFMSIAFQRAGLDRQGALLVAWSSTHAYNIVVDSDEEMWVYEPQNGRFVSLVEDAPEEYRPRALWFPGFSL